MYRLWFLNELAKGPYRSGSQKNNLYPQNYFCECGTARVDLLCIFLLFDQPILNLRVLSSKSGRMWTLFFEKLLQIIEALCLFS